MHRWNVSRKIDCHPLLISIAVKACLQIQKVIHSLPLLFFCSDSESRYLCCIHFSVKKKQKLDLGGYLAILWPFKKMTRGRYQNTALRHDPKDADIWYFMGTSHTMSGREIVKFVSGDCCYLVSYCSFLKREKAQILCRVLGILLQKYRRSVPTH